MKKQPGGRKQAGGAGDRGGGRGGDAFAAGDKQLGSYATGKMKCTALFLSVFELILEAMCLRRVGVDGRSSYAAAPTQVSAVVTQ
jgi:hypothetical protein